MATASSPPLVAHGVFLLLLSISSAIVHGGGADQERRQRYMVVQTSHLLEPKSICSGLKVTPSANGTWVPLHRPYGPCSPSEGTPPSLVEMLRWDQARTDYVRRKATGEVDDVLEPARPHVDMMQVDFMLRGTFGIGSGSGSGAAIDDDDDDDPMILSQSMAIDTTEDVPWIQCLPCPIPQCYPQRNAFFDPRRSSTGAPVRCGSRACRTLGGYANGCSKPNSTGDCLYRIEYSDHRLTLGTYMTDTLTISPSTTFLNFRFGCSHAVRGKFSAQASGTMSLGGGPQSLLSQTARAYGNAFSYCVPGPSAAGFLSIGGPVDDGGGGGSSGAFATTPLVKTANVINPTIYVVRLQGIEVAGRRLNVPPVVFSGGTVMDSSAIITQLPPTAYRALRLAFRNAMRAYKTRAPTGNLDTCFDFVGVTNVTVPTVSLVFDGGAVIELGLLSVLLDSCLAFAPLVADFALGFIGNVQQQTHEVLYDVAGGAVGFRRGTQRRRAFWSRSPAVTSAGRGPRHHRGLARHAHDRPTAPTPCSDVHGARPSVLCFRVSPMPSLYMPSTRLFGGASNSVTTDNGRHGMVIKYPCSESNIYACLTEIAESSY